MFGFLQIKDIEELFKLLKEKNLHFLGNQIDGPTNLNWRMFYTEKDFSKVPQFRGIIHISQIYGLERSISRKLLNEIISEKLLDIARLDNESKLLKNEIQDLKTKLNECHNNNSATNKNLIMNSYINSIDTTITATTNTTTKTTIGATSIDKKQSGGDSIDKSIEELGFFKIKSDQSQQSSPSHKLEEKQNLVNNIANEIPQESIKTETNQQTLSTTSPLHQNEEKQDKQEEVKQEEIKQEEVKQEEVKQEEVKKEEFEEEVKQKEDKQQDGEDFIIEIPQEEDKQKEDKQEEDKQKEEKLEDKQKDGEEFIIEIPQNETLEIIVDTYPRSSNDDVSTAVEMEVEALKTPLFDETTFVTKQQVITNKKLLVYKQSDFFPNMPTLLQSRLKDVTVQEVKDLTKIGLNDNSYGVGDFENVFVLYAVSCMGARTDSERDASKIKSIRSTIGDKVPIIYGVFMIGKNGPTRIKVEHTQASISITHSMSDIGRNLQNNENLKQLQSFLQQ
ncbi:hypothetical protein ACTFIW_008214 [Dictyostelium discoideum]